MKISFYTLGCKLNLAETEALKKSLEHLGCCYVDYGNKEDVAIIRACGVTCNASQTTREILRQAKRRGAYVMAVGCLENKDLPEIDFVGRNNEEVVKQLATISAWGGTAPPSQGGGGSRYSQDRPFCTNKTRAFIKIQTGCNFNCAYCIIPTFRGRSKSVPAAAVVKQINQAVQDGYQEVVLTGVNICAYRNGKKGLAELLKAVLDQTEIPRIRLGSLDPRLISKQLIRLYQNVNGTMEQWNNETTPRLLPHWHLSLQSGADSVLKRMKRLYSSKKYLKIVDKFRKHNPPFSFTTDIIVGFPGETEKEFEETCDLIKKAQFAKVHVFPFSPRPGTAAAAMPNPVQDRIKTERVRRLITIANKVRKNYAMKFIGQTRPVLFEQKKNNLWLGYTPEYVRIKYGSRRNLRNKILNVTINERDIV